jgi:hypothetical protein
MDDLAEAHSPFDDGDRVRDSCSQLTTVSVAIELGDELERAPIEEVRNVVLEALTVRVGAVEFRMHAVELWVTNGAHAQSMGGAADVTSLPL